MRLLTFSDTVTDEEGKAGELVTEGQWHGDWAEIEEAQRQGRGGRAATGRLVARMEAGLADVLEIKPGRRDVDGVRTTAIVCYRGRKREGESDLDTTEKDRDTQNRDQAIVMNRETRAKRKEM